MSLGSYTMGIKGFVSARSTMSVTRIYRATLTGGSSMSYDIKLIAYKGAHMKTSTTIASLIAMSKDLTLQAVDTPDLNIDVVHLILDDASPYGPITITPTAAYIGDGYTALELNENQHINGKVSASIRILDNDIYYDESIMESFQYYCDYKVDMDEYDDMEDLYPKIDFDEPTPMGKYCVT